jgi:CO/xanthine dehydrogenase Mo-binding subunit
MVVEAKHEQEYRVVGTRPIRPDGLEKVTGRAQYGADLQLPGLLYGAVLRSPYPHARIVRVDASNAEALPGVKAVVTRADFGPIVDRDLKLGEGRWTLGDLRRNVLAEEKALYRGHAVAAVAATSSHLATEALGLIEVDYEVLPPVLDVRDAMREDAPLLHEHLRTRSMAGLADTPSNVAAYLRMETGDVAAGLELADVVVEREFTTQMVHQGYIEPQNATALWQSDGQLTVWSSTQGAFIVREQLGALLDLPVHQIKAVPMEIGGGFGGKIPVYLEPLAALLSRKAGRPVKLTMSRTEVFEGTGPTSGSVVRVKMGARADGTLTAVQGTLIYEAGAFPGSHVGAGIGTAIAAYEVPSALLEGYDVVVNKPKVAAYRAPGAPIASFAFESVVDELAEQLEMDPVEFRLKNASKEGTRQLSGRVFGPVGNVECLQAVLNSPHYRAPLEGPNRGRGVATGYWMNVGSQSSALASVNPDGTVSLIEGSVDIGGTRASLAMQLAETLGLPAEAVKPLVADTDAVGFNAPTGGSRTTFASGWAAYEVGMDIRRQLCERAAKIWSVQPETVRYEDGVLTGPDAEQQRLTFADLARQLNGTGGPVVGRSSVVPATTGPAFAAHIADVEVDPETGKVSVLRYTAVQDAGTAIHPAYVEGQLQGGAAQGIGWALNEEYFFDDAGRMQNASFLDYRMPTALDLPMIETIIVEVPNPGHPYGVRGVGEAPLVPALAAVANAVYRATGVRFHDLPISPRRVLEQTLGVS